MLRRYVYAGTDEPVLPVDASGTITYLHHDHQGSLIALTDGTGTLLNKNVYSPFGEVSSFSGSIWGYTGQRFDAETGLYYYKARHYSPVIGRFLQPDPLGYAAGMNLYGYVHNDPLNRTDSAGTDEELTRNATEVPADKNNMINPNRHQELAAELYRQLARDIVAGVAYTPQFLDSLNPHRDALNDPNKGADDRSHHVIQARTVQDELGNIAYNLGLAINVPGNLHLKANDVQRLADIGGNLKAEGQVAYNAIRAMGANAIEATAIVQTSLRQFREKFSMALDSKTSIPIPRQRTLNKELSQ